MKHLVLFCMFLSAAYVKRFLGCYKDTPYPVKFTRNNIKTDYSLTRERFAKTHKLYTPHCVNKVAN